MWLATQCLVQQKRKNMLVKVDGRLAPAITGKDVVLTAIGRIGTAGGTGYAIEFGGQVIRDMSMEGRMTVCNMAIEAGARVGLVAVDDTTLDYVKGRPFAPSGEQWEQAAAAWRELRSDEDAHFDQVVEMRGEDITPQVTWGTSPEMVLPVDASVPDPAGIEDASRRQSVERALEYMGLAPGQAIADIPLDKCVHRLLHQFPHRGLAGRRRPSSRGARSPVPSTRPWWCRVPGGSRPRRRKRGWTGYLSRRAWNGAPPAAPCAWP